MYYCYINVWETLFNRGHDDVMASAPSLLLMKFCFDENNLFAASFYFAVHLYCLP